MYKRILLILGISTILVGCYSYSQPNYKAQFEAQQKELEEIMASWKGSHKKELIQSWGAPDRYESDGGGGQKLIWEQQKAIRISNGSASLQKVITHSKQMYVDADGIIYHWRFDKY